MPGMLGGVGSHEVLGPTVPPPVSARRPRGLFQCSKPVLAWRIWILWQAGTWWFTTQKSWVHPQFFREQTAPTSPINKTRVTTYPNDSWVVQHQLKWKMTHRNEKFISFMGIPLTAWRWPLPLIKLRPALLTWEPPGPRWLWAPGIRVPREEKWATSLCRWLPPSLGLASQDVPVAVSWLVVSNCNWLVVSTMMVNDC